MAQNPDFMKAVFNDVEFSWPRLDQPYRFDQQKRESVPCPATAPMAAFSVSFALPKDRADAFAEKAKQHYETRKAAGSKLPDYSGVFGMKEKDGVIYVTAKRMAVKGDGSENTPPKVVDEYHSDLADKAIWSGSKGSVSILAHPTTNPQNGLGGISILLRNVLVTDARYGGDGLEDDFGSPKQRTASDMDQGGNYMRDAGDPGPAPADLDDDIPF